MKRGFTFYIFIYLFKDANTIHALERPAKKKQE